MVFIDVPENKRCSDDVSSLHLIYCTNRFFDKQSHVVLYQKLFEPFYFWFDIVFV